MIKTRTAVTLAVGAVAALSIGGTAAMAAGTDNPSPAATSGSVDMLPDGTPVTPQPTFSADNNPSPSDLASGSPSATTTSSAPAPSTSSKSSKSSKSSTAGSAAGISLARAKAIAIKAAGGGSVTKAEREWEHGRQVYDIDVRRGSVGNDIDVDVQTGKVTRHKQDHDDVNGRTGTSARGSDDGVNHDRNDDKGGLRDDHSSDDKGDKGGKGGKGHGSDD